MIDRDLQERMLRLREFITDELGIAILWVEALIALAKQGDQALATTKLDESAKTKLMTWAANEIQNAAPRVNARLALGLWSALEALIEDLFVLRLAGNEARLSDERLERARIPFAEFLRLDEAGRLRALADRASGVQSKSAFGRFEALLDIAELSGAVHESVRRTLLELEQVRHTLMHRNGIADSNLVDSLYKLDVKVGDEVEISADHFYRYYQAVNAYGETILERLAAEDEGRAPGPPTSFEESEVAEALEGLDAG